MFITLSEMRSQLPNVTLDEAVNAHQIWLSHNQYLLGSYGVLAPKKQVLKRFQFAKCSKRGNDVYAYRTEKRFDTFLIPLIQCKEMFSYQPNFIEGQPLEFTNCMFLTLTFDTKLCSMNEAWTKIAKDWNRYLSNLKKLFGKVYIVRCFEAFENGYPHIHAVLYCPEFPLRVGRVDKKVNKTTGKTRIYLRCEDWLNDWLHSYWHSHISCELIERPSKAVKYISKYITKAAKLTTATPCLTESGAANRRGEKPFWSEEPKRGGPRAAALISDSIKTANTLGMTWLHRKRAFSIGIGFRKIVNNAFAELNSRLDKEFSLTQTDRGRRQSGILPFLCARSREWHAQGRGFVSQAGLEWSLIKVVSQKMVGFAPKGMFCFGVADCKISKLGLDVPPRTILGPKRSIFTPQSQKRLSAFNGKWVKPNSVF